MENETPTPQDNNAASNASSATIVISYSTIQISPQGGMSINEVAPNPLVSLYQNTAYQNGYDVYVVAFIPHGATNLGFSFINNSGSNVTTIHLIPSGTLTVRGFQITYTFPGPYTNSMLYDVFQFHCLYQVNANQPQAQGIVSVYNDNDPVTTRGTVTTVMLT